LPKKILTGTGSLVGSLEELMLATKPSLEGDAKVIAEFHGARRLISLVDEAHPLGRLPRPKLRKILEMLGRLINNHTIARPAGAHARNEPRRIQGSDPLVTVLCTRETCLSESMTPMPASSDSAVASLAKKLGRTWSAIDACAIDADMQRQRISDVLRKEKLIPSDCSFIVSGSLARNEFTPGPSKGATDKKIEGSDIDWTLLVDGEADPQHLPAIQKIANVLKDLGINLRDLLHSSEALSLATISCT
jgi:hypothetical protein